MMETPAGTKKKVSPHRAHSTLAIFTLEFFWWTELQGFTVKTLLADQSLQKIHV